MRHPFATAAAAFALAATASAQCQFLSVSSQTTGAGCNAASTGFCAVVALPSFLEFQLDNSICELDVTVTAFEGCGAVVPLRALAIGFAPTFVPLPDLGLGCALQVDPIAILPSTAPTLTLTLPPGVPAMTFQAQGVAWSHFPLSPQPDTLVLTAPYQIDLQ